MQTKSHDSSLFQKLIIHKGSEMFVAKQPKKRTGLDAWYPYYAGFSNEYAEAILTAIKSKKNLKIMDPWNGSGTTTLAADRFGFDSIGIDVNPVAALVANSKLARPDDASNVLGFVRSTIAKLDASRMNSTNDPLSQWIGKKNASLYRGFENEILRNLASEVLEGKSRQTVIGNLPPLASFLMLSLMRAAKGGAAIEQHSNPTWIKPATELRITKHFSLGHEWIQMVRQMSEELKSYGSNSKSKSIIIVGNSKNNPAKNDSIDVVITSPPYCTRIDYIVNSAFELAAIGVPYHSAEFSNLRRATMGTPLSRIIEEESTLMPKSVNELIAKIRSHHSKASESYYYKTYNQYFCDAIKSLSEIKRVTKNGGIACFVVQTSYYKDIFVDLPKLYLDMGCNQGFNAEMLHKKEVKHHLTQINSRSSAHAAEKICYEATILMEVKK